MNLVCIYDSGTYCVRDGRRKVVFGKGRAFGLEGSRQPAEGELAERYKSDNWYVGQASNEVTVVVHVPTGNMLYGTVSLLLPATDDTVDAAFRNYARTFTNKSYATLVGPLNAAMTGDVASHVQSLTDGGGRSPSGNIEFCIPPASPSSGLMWRKFSGENWEVREHEVLAGRAALVHKRTDVWITVGGKFASRLSECDSDMKCFVAFCCILVDVPAEQGQAILTAITAVSYAVGFTEALARAEAEIGEQFRKLKGE